MQLARIAFAGALLFGVGCELPEEGDLATDERLDLENLDDSMDYATEEIVAVDDAIDDTMALSSDISEAMESTVLLADDDANTLGGGHEKWKCCYCHDDDGDDDNGKDTGKYTSTGKDDEDCYCAKDKKKKKAKKKAKHKCEDEHHGDDCEFDECKKVD